MKTLLMALFLAAIGAIAWAGNINIENGQAAHERGDYAEAVRWYRLAATQGDAKDQLTVKAQVLVGLYYMEGKGVVQDYAEAMRWFRLAVAKGNDDGQLQLGKMYYLGTGVVQDHAEALRWFRLAATKGNAKAQYALGVMYYRGEGVVPDETRAHMWFNIAAAKGDKLAVKNRDMVAGEMTPQQIAQAQKMAGECRARNLKNCD